MSVTGVEHPRSPARRAFLGVLTAVGVAVLVACGGFVLLLFYSAVFVVVRSVRGLPIDGAGPADPWAMGIAAGLVVVAAASVWLASRVEWRRGRLVRRWAVAHGWSTDVRRSTLSGRWDAPPFGRAGGQLVRDAVRRTDGRGTVFSFSYRCGQFRHVVMTERDMLGPGLRLTPEGPAGRAATALGGQDITVEWQAFNDRWRIESQHPRFAHAVLHPRMMERLMEPDTAGVSVLVEGSDVVVHCAGRADLDRIEPLACLVLDVADLLPRFVVDDHPLAAATDRREMRRLRAERWRRR